MLDQITLEMDLWDLEDQICVIEVLNESSQTTEGLTGGVVVEHGVVVLTAVVVPKQSLVVAVFIPVQRLDLQSTTLGVTTRDPGDRLVQDAGGWRGVLRQEDDLIPQVHPALHSGQLQRNQGERWDWMRGGYSSVLGFRAENQVFFYLALKVKTYMCINLERQDGKRWIFRKTKLNKNNCLK